MATTIKSNHRDFIAERVQDEIANSQEQIEGSAILGEHPEPPPENFFLKLLAVRVVELLGATTPKRNPIRITEYLMTKSILLLAAVIGLASGVYAADPSPSASPGKKKTHHGHHQKTAAPSASPSATP